MTEQEYREKVAAILAESREQIMMPIIKQITDLICKAYEAGVNVGMKVQEL